MWKDVEPFYPDQTRGLPKTSESRATEAILNALILSTRDAQSGTLSNEGRQAFANLWPLQFKAGEQTGAWTWLNFHNEPWEANGSPYFGNALAALAIGTAPGGYAASPDLQDRLTLLQRYLQKGVETESLYNRLTVLWASGTWPTLLTRDQRQAIVQSALAKQQDDGGWTMASLSNWKRADGSALDTTSDGLATGLATLALQQAGVPRSDAHVSRGLAWLVQHQDAATGMWSASSLNKQRDPASDVGKFMSDAATAYAVLSLTNER
jgi:squalene-hopene/tetraprenyl-beta-curcumene cyclase